MHFDRAWKYVLENEGVDSNHPKDRGGRTRFGISRAVALNHGYAVEDLTREQAGQIAREDYWFFDRITDARLAAKLLDVTFNCGAAGGVVLIQRATGVPEDGKWGAVTEDAASTMNPDEVIERVSMALADHYVDICLRNPSQLAFLKGWMRRAVRRPRSE